MSNTVTLISGELVCTCGAKAQDNSSESKRFKKRHPGKCSERRDFTKQLAQGTRSVDGDNPFLWSPLGGAQEALEFGQLEPRAEKALRRLLGTK
jgi:hypothetical protein